VTVRAFVLSGGGAKGAWQVGAMQRVLERLDQQVDAFFGVSTGALSAAMLAQGFTLAEQRQQLDELARIYSTEIHGNSSIYLGPRTTIGKGLKLLRRQLFGADPALFNPAPLAALIERHISTERLAVGAYFACGCVDVATGDYVLVDRHSPNVRRAILASASMPIFFPPVDVYGDGGTFLDGGLRSITPLRDAVRWLKQQPDPQRELYVFLTSPLTVTEQRPRPWSPTRIASRSLEIVLNTIYRADLLELRNRNRALLNGLMGDMLRWDGAPPPAVRTPPASVLIKTAVMAPALHLAGHALDFSPDLLDQYLADGYNSYPEDPRA